MSNITVPSFFSRLYETAFAFNNVVKYERECRFARADNQTEYHKIVSQTLDVMECIFLYGKVLEVETIRMSDIQQLRHSINAGNIFLGKIIEEDISADHNLAGITDFHLFLLNGKCIGGVSPYTFIYPSADIENMNFEFLVVPHRGLFRDIVPLQDRNSRFVEFLICLNTFYHLPECLSDYISICCEHSRFRQFVPSQKMFSEYEILCDSNGNQLTLNGVPLFVMPVESLINQTSDYVIQPTVVNNNPNTDKLPLVISEQGIHRTRYLYDTVCQPGFFLYVDSKIPIGDRILPGTFFKYPYLCADDFLESEIFQIGQDGGCSDKFLTLFVEGENYLLPLKPFFFKYFRIEDVNEMLIVHKSESSISVSLRIPLVGICRYFELCKHYHVSDVVVTNRFANIAVTPFYKYQSEQYTVLSSFGNDVSFEFFDTSTGIYAEHSSDILNYFSSYKTKGAWDIIQIRTEDVTGLLVPKFNKYFDHPLDNISFSLFIGDSETSIIQQKGFYRCEKLTIDGDDNLIGMLFEDQSHSCFADWFDFPCGYNDKCICSPFPAAVKSISSEKSFICFDLNKLLPAVESNIMSCIDRAVRGDARLLIAYIEQLTQILKAKALKECSNPNFNLEVVLPSWLTCVEKSAYSQIWINVFNEFNFDPDNITFIGVEKHIVLRSLLLHPIDKGRVMIFIDEKHTDIVYANSKENIYKSFSILLGIGNVLGEAGADFRLPISDSNSENYYVKRIIQSILEMEVRHSIYHSIYNSHYSVLDLIDLLEKHDSLSFVKSEQLFRNSISIYIFVVVSYVCAFLRKYNLKNDCEFIFGGVGAKLMSKCGIEYYRMQDVLGGLLRAFDDKAEARVRYLEYLEYLESGALLSPEKNIDIEVERCCMYGFDEERSDSVISFEEAIHNKDYFIRTFFEGFFDGQVQHILSYYLDVNFDSEERNELMGFAFHSFDDCASEYHNKMRDVSYVTEPIYFWPFRNLFWHFARWFDGRTN